MGFLTSGRGILIRKPQASQVATRYKRELNPRVEVLDGEAAYQQSGLGVFSRRLSCLL